MDQAQPSWMACSATDYPGNGEQQLPQGGKENEICIRGEQSIVISYINSTTSEVWSPTQFYTKIGIHELGEKLSLYKTISL